jgi:Ni,Fe-hydrogenase III large subunit
MHFEEGRISRQLGMKINVLENAINQLIKIVSQITLDNQRIQRSLDKLQKAGAGAGAGTASQEATKGDDNYELDISQVQKILKQQTHASTLGKRIIDN